MLPKTKPKIVSLLLFFVGLCNNLSLMWEVELSHNSTIPSCCSLSNSRKTSLFPFKAIPNGLEKTCPTEVTSAFSQVIFDFFFKFLLLMPGAKPPALTGDQISFTHIPAKTVAIRCLYCPFDAHFTSLLLVTYHLVTQPPDVHIQSFPLLHTSYNHTKEDYEGQSANTSFCLTSIEEPIPEHLRDLV